MSGRKRRVLRGPFGDLLKQYGLTPHELATRLGRPVQAIHRVADGRKLPYAKHTQAMADAIGVPPEELLRIIHEQEAYARHVRFVKTLADITDFISQHPPRYDAKMETAGLSRRRVKETIGHLQRWLDVG